MSLMTSSDRRMAEIQREQDANAIIALLKRNQVKIENGNIEFISSPKGTLWNAGTIASCLGIEYDENRVMRAIVYLCSHQRLERRGSQFFVTIFGVESYRVESMRPEIYLGSSEIVFREEVLTGSVEIKGRLEKTTIENAALPNGSHNFRPDNNIENRQLKRCASVKLVQKIADENGVQYQEAIDMLTSGEIHRCSRCGMQRRHHRHKGKGGQWNSPCITCRKASRVCKSKNELNSELEAK